MRVITGSARGMRLSALQGDATRPTSEKVKEAVFSMIQFEIEGRRVLDLFGGSGQMGIEALSRGAKSAVFLDNSADAVKIIKDNLAFCRLGGKAEVLRRDFKTYLECTSNCFDIAIVDPPYYAGVYEDALLLTAKRMSDSGVIICEHPLDVSVPSALGDFSISRERRFGKTVITLYRKSTQEE